MILASQQAVASRKTFDLVVAKGGALPTSNSLSSSNRYLQTRNYNKSAKHFVSSQCAFLNGP